MPDVKRSLAALQTLLADNTAGDISPQDVRDFLVSVYPIDRSGPQGRLTTESGVALSSSDRTAQSTIYYTPYNGNSVWLYDGTIWQSYSFTERSLSLSGLTSGKNYDVFLYDNSGTLTLELSAAWTTDAARADALTTQDGVLVKSGSTTRLYVGTIRTTGTTTTEDSAAKRFVWNAYNQVQRAMQVADSTDTWTYASTTVRYANGSSANRVEMVCGASVSVNAEVAAIFYNNVASVGAVAGVGVDSATALSGVFASTYSFNSTAYQVTPMVGKYQGILSAGFHFFAWLEACTTTGTATFFGDNGTPLLTKAGLVGTVPG